MRVFVTGATGLLGSNLVHLLVDSGHQVVAMVRDRDKAGRQLPTQVTLVEGDLDSVDQVEPEIAGCHAVVHCAAYFREYYRRGDHWAHLFSRNVEATLQLAEAAKRQGVERFVHIGSSGTVGAPGDETAGPGAECEMNLYFKSKLLADRSLAERGYAESIGLVTVLPGWMFGPRDAAPTDAGQLVLDFLGDNLPAIPPGGTTVDDARDVALAILRVLEGQARSSRYVVAGRHATLRQIANGLSKVSGKPAPRWNLPYPLALLLGTLSEMVGRLLDKDPLITRVAVKTMAANRHHVSALAEKGVGSVFSTSRRDAGRLRGLVSKR